MARLTGGEALAKQLHREGVRVVFGLPGVQLYGAMAGLRDEPNVRFITTRHEQATTYMADGYARAGGGVGVALVVPGPGLLNALSGLSTAYAASSPVFLIAGQVPKVVAQGRRIVEVAIQQLGGPRGPPHEGASPGVTGSPPSVTSPTASPASARTRSARRAGRYRGAASAHTMPPTTMAVVSEVAAAIEVRTSEPTAAAGWNRSRRFCSRSPARGYSAGCPWSLACAGSGPATSDSARRKNSMRPNVAPRRSTSKPWRP